MTSPRPPVLDHGAHSAPTKTMFMALGLEGEGEGGGGGAGLGVALLTFTVVGVEAVGGGVGAVGVCVACDDKGEPKVKEEGGGLAVCDGDGGGRGGGGATTDDDGAVAEAMEVPIDELVVVVGTESTLLSILEVSPAWALFLSSICAMTSWWSFHTSCSAATSGDFSSSSLAAAAFDLVLAAAVRLRRVFVLPSLFGVAAARTGVAAVGSGNGWENVSWCVRS